MTYPKLVSRRALRLLLEKHPRLSPYPLSVPNRSTNDTSWPWSFQLMAYALVSLSVPYSFFVVVSESPRLREYMEDRSNIGKSLVELTRWYWGEIEHVPYSEFMDKNGTRTVSLSNEMCGMVREEQREIGRNINSDVTVGVMSMFDKEVTKVVGRVNGDTAVNDTMEIWNVLGSKSQSSFNGSNGFVLTFDDDEEEELTNYTWKEIERMEEKGLRKLINVWSVWDYFPPNMIGSLTNKSSCSNKSRSHRKNTDRETELKISELEWYVSELTKYLCDPDCTRDRDDMEWELRECKKKLWMWRRRRWCGQWRNLLSK